MPAGADFQVGQRVYTYRNINGSKILTGRILVVRITEQYAIAKIKYEGINKIKIGNAVVKPKNTKSPIL